MKDVGYTIIPLSIFFNEKHLLKLKLGLAKEKNCTIKEKQLKRRKPDREIKRYLLNNFRLITNFIKCNGYIARLS